MRHRKLRGRLNRFRSLRTATLRSLSRSLLIHEKIKTTKTKAKFLKRFVDRLIHRSLEDSLSNRRYAFKELGSHKLVKKLFDEIAPLLKEIKGGYTRIIPYSLRQGDGAKLAILELTVKTKKEKIKKPKQKEEPKETAAVSEPKEIPKKVTPPKEEKIKPAPPKKFFKGLRGFFKKERDAL